MTQPNQPDAPLGFFEYELTDDLAYQAALALFEHQARTVKEGILREGVPHPALPIVIASVTLLLASFGAAIWAWDFVLTLPLLVASGLVQLLLLFKAGLYFCPSFTRWYIRRGTSRMVRRLSSRTIRWTLFEDRLETKSAVAHRSVPWTDFTKIEVHVDVWHLQSKSGVQLFVPAEVISDELQRHIRRKAAQTWAALDRGP